MAHYIDLRFGDEAWCKTFDDTHTVFLSALSVIQVDDNSFIAVQSCKEFSDTLANIDLTGVFGTVSASPGSDCRAVWY